MGQFRISRVVEFRLETIVEYAVHGLRGKELDAVFISYTNLRGLEASDLVAAELKLPGNYLQWRRLQGPCWFLLLTLHLFLDSECGNLAKS